MEKGLHGRELELDQVMQAFRRADLVGVALTGEPGLGKSSLLAGVVGRAEGEGFAVVRIYGSRATANLPLCAFSSLLEPGDAEAPVERFVAVRQALGTLAANRPLLLAIDDAHFLDDASAVLVSQLARELAAFVACTVRTGEPAPEPLSALWMQGLMLLVPVEPVGREAAAQIAADALGGPMDAGLEAELWHRTSGNPLFLRELVLGSLAAGAVRQTGSAWSQTGPLAPSNALADLIRARLAALADDTQHALCCVAL